MNAQAMAFEPQAFTSDLPKDYDVVTSADQAMSEDGNLDLDAEMNVDQSQPYQDDAQMENEDAEYTDQQMDADAIQEETIEVEIQEEGKVGGEKEDSILPSSEKEIEMQAAQSTPKIQDETPLPDQDQDQDQVVQDALEGPTSTLLESTTTSLSHPPSLPINQSTLNGTSHKAEPASSSVVVTEKETVEEEYGQESGSGAAENLVTESGDAQPSNEFSQGGEEEAQPVIQDESNQVELSVPPQDGAVNPQTGDGEEEEVDASSPSDQAIPSIRVTFNGQDFVMFPSSSSTSECYIGLDLTADPNSTEASQGQLTVEVPAPPLRAPKETFHAPLASLFDAFRVKEVLGDFLEEGTEIIIWCPELELSIREDDVYSREISLEDLHRLHSSCGIQTSMHLELSEGQRFINRYNALAAEVGGMIEDQLAKEDEGENNEDGAVEEQTGASEHHAQNVEHNKTSEEPIESQADVVGASKVGPTQGQEDNQEEVESYETATPFPSSMANETQVEEQRSEEVEVGAQLEGEETFVTTVDDEEGQVDPTETGEGEGQDEEEVENHGGKNEEEHQNQEEYGEVEGGEEEEEVLEYTEEGVEDGNQTEEQVIEDEEAQFDSEESRFNKSEYLNHREGYGQEVEGEDGEVAADDEEQILEYEEEDQPQIAAATDEDAEEGTLDPAASAAEAPEDYIYEEESEPAAHINGNGSAEEHASEEVSTLPTTLKTKRSHEDADGEGLNGEFGEFEENDSKRSKIE